MLAMLRHPRIVQYYGSQHCDSGSLAIFMEYMPGVSELITVFEVFLSILIAQSF